VSPQGRFLRVNPILCELTGYSEPELLERTFQQITHPEDVHLGMDEYERLLAGEIGAYQTEKRYVRPDGTVVWVMLSASLVRDSAGQPLHFVSHVQDITERRRAQEELERLASQDPLTGLLNRRRFDEELERELHRLEREPDRRAALLLLDVDRFKFVNDSLGHRAGDHVLCAVAQTLTHRLRGPDVVARLGGDEFALLLLDLHGPEDAREIATDLIAAIEAQSILTVGGAARVTVSIGVVALDHTTRDRWADTLVAADNAMYRAKGAGRNRVSLAA
jgi:diguanylate cyclase (GGDEF)-like protein/PAS domain S-box-containing protein